jgi:protocatechuate 3,4-dioxygenase beta subunit
MIRKQARSFLAVGLLAATTFAQEDGAFPIRGRVVDADAKPVAGAEVRLLAAGFDAFDVDAKTTSDAQGRFRIAAPPGWSRTDATQRQELGLIARLGDRLAVVRFDRHSAPPRTEVALAFSRPAASQITVLSPDLRPVVGARIKLEGLLADTIWVDLTKAEVPQFGGRARKTPLGYAISTGLVSLPPDLQMELGVTDAKGNAAIMQVATAEIGALTIHTEKFGEQTLSNYGYGAVKSSDWARRIVLKKTGRVLGQLTGPGGEGIADREVTLASFPQGNDGGIAHGSAAKVVTDRDGRFEVPKMVPGMVQWTVKLEPGQPLGAEQPKSPPELKAGESFNLKIILKPAVRVEGRVLEADSRKPIPAVPVRAFMGNSFESATSDQAGKFVFWMPPGETAFLPTLPEEYLPAAAPSDYLDARKLQKSVAVFKVPEGKRFEAPPILLQRAATQRGLVLDAQGRPLPRSAISGITMALDRRVGQPKPREVTTQTNERGEFKIAGLDPREPLRLRVTSRDVSKVVTIAQPGRESVRLVIAENERFRIAGQVADAEGKPVADAVLEIWHRDWRPGLAEAEPQKLELQALRTDGEGRFRTPPLVPDGHYRFTIRAAGVKTTDSVWLDATRPEAARPQHLVVTRLGGMTGVVCDRGGKPIADVQVFLFARDTRTETNTNDRGEFKVEIPAGKPFCLVMRHPEFRVQGAYYERKPENLKQILVRFSEPAEKLPRQPLLTSEERVTMFKRLFEPIKQRLAQSKSTDEKARTLQALTGVAPDFVIEYVDQHPLQPAIYNEMLLTQVAMKRAERAPEEVEEMIGRMTPGAQKSMAYSRLVDALPEKARTRKLELLAEALIGARAEKAPEFRAIALGQVGTRLLALGEKERATILLREGEKIARGLSTGEFAGYARGTFATDLALIDLPAALALMKGLKDPREFTRHHGNTAHRIAGSHSADAVRVLDLIPPPRTNEFNQRDHYAIRVCYRIARVDQLAALKLADSITDLPSRAYALGVIARAVAARAPKEAVELLRRAFVLLDTEAARPDGPQFTSPLLPGTVAAALVLLAEQVDAKLVRECLWRAIALQRPPTDDPQQVWRYHTGNNALAMAAARYDRTLAEFLLAPPTTQFYSREAALAGFLVHPRRSVANVDKAPKGKDDRELLQLIGFVTTEDDRIPRLILNTLGIWRIDVEDIDE